MIELYHGDCLRIMKDLPPESVDMVLVDPPYGLTRCEWDKSLDWGGLWEELKRIGKSHSAYLIFSIQPFTSNLIASNPKMFRYEIIWEKTQPSGFLNAKKMPLRKHENILVFYQHLPTYNPIMTIVEAKGLGRKKVNGTQAKQYNPYIVGKWEWEETGKRYPTDVIKFSNWNGALFGNVDNAVKHSTQKPVELLEYLIKTYSNPGDVVLDFTMGSGSTGVAAVRTNRDFIGIELDDNYFEIAKSRIQQESNENLTSHE